MPASGRSRIDRAPQARRPQRQEFINQTTGLQFIKSFHALAKPIHGQLLDVTFIQIDVGHDSLRDLVSTNAESLRLLRIGLTRQCVMPMDSALININRLAGMKRLVHLLTAEGRLREMDDRPAHDISPPRHQLVVL